MKSTWWAGDLPHHDGSPRYTDGGLASNKAITVFVLEPKIGVVNECAVRFTRDGDGFVEQGIIDRVDEKGRWWRASIPLAAGSVSYRFELTSARKLYLNAAGVHTIEPPDVFDFHLDLNDRCTWLTPGDIIYQIFIDRFARAAVSECEGLSSWDAPVESEWPANVQQFYGGDLLGIAERIPYLRALGVTTIMLTPFFPSPESHRYAASDFRVVDPLLGGDEALVHLVRALHDEGMRCIGDLTLNHCGAAHSWFRLAKEDRDSAEASIFAFFNWPDGVATYHGVASLPRFTYGSEETFGRMVDGPHAVARHWLRPPFNLDGWRLDVAGSIGRIDDEDNNVEVRRRLRSAVRQERSDAALIGEIPRDPAADLGADGWPGALLDAGFASPVRRWLSDPPAYGGRDLVAALSTYAAQLSWQALSHSASFIGSHDYGRIASMVDDDTQLRAAFGLLLTLVSAPVIFAGDEVGLRGSNADLARQPICWERNGLAPMGDHDLLRLVGELITLRTEQEPLHNGGLRWLCATDDALLYERATAHERIVCFVARRDTELIVPGDLGETQEALLDAASCAMFEGRRLVAKGRRTIGFWRVT